MAIANQLIIIILCVFQFFIKKLKKPPTKVQSQIKVVKIQQTPKQQSQPLNPEVSELQELLEKKQQIQSTVQQFNTPSTFAKYSKMKRQLLKIDSRIKQLRTSLDSPASLTTETKATKTEQQKDSQAGKINQEEVKKQGQNLMPAWFGIFFNVVIMCLSMTMSTKVLANWSQFPLNWVADQGGRASCLLVYLAFKMIIN